MPIAPLGQVKLFFNLRIETEGGAVNCRDARSMVGAMARWPISAEYRSLLTLDDYRGLLQGRVQCLVENV